MKTVKYLFVLLATFTLVGWFFVRKDGKSTLEVQPSESEGVLGTQSNKEGEVEVNITPKELGQDFWTFEVVLDTHSIELSDDLASSSFLMDDAGGRFETVSWEGDPPGGHHRQGILKFNKVSPNPKEIEIRIANVGGISERVFKWEF